RQEITLSARSVAITIARARSGVFPNGLPLSSLAAHTEPYRGRLRDLDTGLCPERFSLRSASLVVAGQARFVQEDDVRPVERTENPSDKIGEQVRLPWMPSCACKTCRKPQNTCPHRLNRAHSQQNARRPRRESLPAAWRTRQAY